ncbi:lipopolysaccharide transport system LptD protein, partial [Bordetella hinzii L60]
MASQACRDARRESVWGEFKAASLAEVLFGGTGGTRAGAPNLGRSRKPGRRGFSIIPGRSSVRPGLASPHRHRLVFTRAYDQVVDPLRSQRRRGRSGPRQPGCRPCPEGRQAHEQRRRRLRPRNARPAYLPGSAGAPLSRRANPGLYGSRRYFRGSILGNHAQGQCPGAACRWGGQGRQHPLQQRDGRRERQGQCAHHARCHAGDRPFGPAQHEHLQRRDREAQFLDRRQRRGGA